MPEWDKREKPPGMREWDKWDKSRAAAPQVSSSCQLQLPTWSRPQKQLPNIVIQLMLQDKKEELLEHPILANTDSSPATEQKQ